MIGLLAVNRNSLELKFCVTIFSCLFKNHWLKTYMQHIYADTQTPKLCGMLEPTCTLIWTRDACWTFRHFVGFFVKHSYYYSLNNLYWKTVEVNIQSSSLSSYFLHVTSLCGQCSWRSYLRCLLTKSHDDAGWYRMYYAEVQSPWVRMWWLVDGNLRRIICLF